MRIHRKPVFVPVHAFAVDGSGDMDDDDAIVNDWSSDTLRNE